MPRRGRRSCWGRQQCLPSRTPSRLLRYSVEAAARRPRRARVHHESVAKRLQLRAGARRGHRGRARHAGRHDRRRRPRHRSQEIQDQQEGAARRRGHDRIRRIGRRRIPHPLLRVLRRRPRRHEGYAGSGCEERPLKSIYEQFASVPARARTHRVVRRARVRASAGRARAGRRRHRRARTTIRIAIRTMRSRTSTSRRSTPTCACRRARWRSG